VGTVEGRTWLEVLTPVECRALLRTTTVGRVAFVVEDHPEVMPVNYGMDGDAVVFRTDPGTKLTAALTQRSVAFQVDRADEDAGEGWSVLVVGPAQRVSDPAETARLATLGVRPWASGDKAHWVRMETRAITGRRIVR
jgi:nitroimidazol reductase NimA-like FMN-containing flavoprotein (pyridoxamine 5'-phosphate oxidase superfamily)